jgi:hypothetical protein
MTGDASSESATVVHGAASEVEVAAVHAALTRHVRPPSGALTDLARWRGQRLAALAKTPRCH